MRKLIFFVMLATSVQLKAQNTDYLITMDGVGKLKIDMTVDEVEKLLGKKFNLSLNDEDGSYMDTVKTKYKAIDVILYFERQYEDDTVYKMALYGMKVTNPLCKTKSGLGIGTDKIRLINDYETYFLRVAPDWTDDTYMTLSKTKSSVYVYDHDSEKAIIFQLNNKKVASIEVLKIYEH